MKSKNIVIKVENVSKCYRIGLKKNIDDTFSKSVLNFIKSPVNNLRKYRSLYKFDDLKPGQGNNHNPSDIIWALKDISFDVKEGEIIGIIGFNGAGKSTLLKILSRITEPTGGRVEIRGRVTSLLEVGTGFHPELTGRENVYLNGTILGMRKKEIDGKFDEIVDFSEVEKFIDTPVKRYSSGMTVRLAFAVSAHLEPEILILDEVLAVGDALFQKKCLKKMQDVAHQGRTVLFVSHNMPSIIRLCKRAVLLDDGRVLKDGLSQQVVHEYLNSETDTLAERKWVDPEDMPGGEIARLRAVRVRNEDGRVDDTISISQDVRVEIEYDILKSGFILQPNFQFYNEEGLHIFSTHDIDPFWRQKPRPEGRYVSAVWIPGNFLSEGKMFVSAGFETNNPSIFQFYESDIVVFKVVDDFNNNSARGDFTGEINGAVRPLLKWTTQSIPKDTKLL